MFEQIIYGMLSGVAYSIIGWQKGASQAKAGSSVRLDWGKLLKTTLICVVVGGVAGYSGQEFNILVTGSFGITVTALVNSGFKIVKSKLGF